MCPPRRALRHELTSVGRTEARKMPFTSAPRSTLSIRRQTWLQTQRALVSYHFQMCVDGRTHRVAALLMVGIDLQTEVHDRLGQESKAALLLLSFQVFVEPGDGLLLGLA